jgi:hypothetical protein
MLKLQTHSDFHDLFLNLIEVDQVHLTNFEPGFEPADLLSSVGY